MGPSDSAVARSVESPRYSLSTQAPVSSDGARNLVRDLAADADEVLKVTGSLCPDCVAEERFDDPAVPMVVYEAEGEIRLAKRCEEHGVTRDVYWSDAEMYRRAREWAEWDDHLDTAHEIPKGPIQCPTDCGLCPMHKSHTGLGNITVTNRCDLSCWYCFFYAREDDPIYEPTKAQLREMVRRTAEEDPIGANAIQLTGGEPTLRDDLVEIVEIAREYVDHVQLNTHSAVLAGDVDRVEALRDAGVTTIYTSFDGVDPGTNSKNYWELPEAIRTYREAGVGTVLVPTIIGGTNVDQVGDVVRFGAANSDVVRGVNFQPVSLVGRMPKSKRETQRVTIPDVIHALEDQTDGAVPTDAWHPIPSVLPVSRFAETWNGSPLYELSNHFACGMATYVYLDGDDLVPITDFLDVDAFVHALDEIADRFDSPLSRVEKTRVGARLAWELYQAVDREAEPEDVRIGRWLREALTEATYEGLVEFHRNALFLGIMHFQDPYNYDVDRVERCDIHYAMPDGRVVPFCAYNVLPELYRDAVHEDYSITAEEWADRDYTAFADSDSPDRTRLRTETVTGRDEDDDVLRDGPGIFGYDVKTRRTLDDSEKERVRAAYRRSIADLEPV